MKANKEKYEELLTLKWNSNNAPNTVDGFYKLILKGYNDQNTKRTDGLVGGPLEKELTFHALYKVSTNWKINFPPSMIKTPTAESPGAESFLIPDTGNIFCCF